MQSKEKENLLFIKLNENENLNDMIKKACFKHDVKTGVILSGIGQIKDVTLGYFKEKGNYSPQEFNKTLEILSLSGNIVRDDKEHILHLHIILGDENKKAIGGHFIKGKIGVTAEIIILKTDIEAKRVKSKKTGLKTLSIQ